jgi:hypothetical protein
VERWQREQILGEWGVRDGSARSHLEGRVLEEELQTADLHGRPLRRRLRNFRPEADRYLASLGGPLPYMRRLRRIEEETELLLARLAEAYEEHRRDPATWRRVVERWDFGELNELIEKHNRWYPIEARLAMDPKTRDYVKVGGRPYRREPVTAAWVLARFPA